MVKAMKLICHPEKFRTGTRVIMLKGRYKDGLTRQRQIFRVSHSVREFDAAIDELRAIAREGERIYASAGARCMVRAIREFKRRQLDADYDANPRLFYERLWDRWVSCLMAPTSQEEMFWLFDCDSREEADMVMRELGELYHREMQPYCYPTKSGKHILVQPFNRTKLRPEVAPLIHENPIILWGY